MVDPIDGILVDVLIYSFGLSSPRLNLPLGIITAYTSGSHAPVTKDLGNKFKLFLFTSLLTSLQGLT